MDVVAPLLESLLTEVQSRLPEETPVGTISLTPGSTVAWDDCCAGQVWVRVLSITPVASAPACGIDSLRVEAAVGIVRCWQGLDDSGRPPTADEMTADAQQMLGDADLLLKSLLSWSPPTGARRPLLGRGTPLGPEGYCGGFEWNFTVQVLTCE